MPVQGSSLSCPQLVSTPASTQCLDSNSHTVLTKAPVHGSPSEHSHVLRWLDVLAVTCMKAWARKLCSNRKCVPAGLQAAPAYQDAEAVALSSCEIFVCSFMQAARASLLAGQLNTGRPLFEPLHVSWQVASEKGKGFCKVPSPSAVLGVNACDISCKRCKPCACFDYCPFCSDAPPVTAPGATCPQLACPAHLNLVAQPQH